MAEPPRRPLPPRPSSRPTGTPAPSSTRPALPSSPQIDVPMAPPLGPPESVRSPMESSPDLSGDARRLGTVRLRPLIDIGLAQLTLVIEQENGVPNGRTIEHEGDAIRIGTHQSNEIQLSDPAVSRFHCRIVPDAHGWRVEDLGSLNGTLVHDLRVNSAVLPPDAVIVVGKSVVRVRSSARPSQQQLVPMMAQFGGLTGTGRAMRKLFALLEKVAASDINCHIHGESGTGKELVATEVVQRGARADKPFVVVDCGAISPNLVESELFGHVRGAFTGAERDRVGAFEAADGGTVFLDEVGELPLEVQPKLLRALEQREIKRVGQTNARKVNVRVISATNRDLEREVNRGSFREDLYFRLAVITVRVPPLRERLEDMPHLIRHFLGQLGAGESEHLFGPQVIAELSTHEWPGNVRELRNYVERSVVLQTTRMSMLPQPRMPTPSKPDLSAVAMGTEVDVNVPYKVAKEALVDNFERGYVKAVLAACGGNLTKAAKMAGIDRMYLHRLVQKHARRDDVQSASSPSEPSSAQQRKPVE